MDKKLWQLAKKLFDQLQELPVEQRAEFLDRQTQGQPQLLQLINKMWQANHDDSFMTSSPVVFMQETDDSMVGHNFGGYVIIRKVAVGGMGRIYQAKKVDADVPVLVALKIIRRELVDDAMRVRFDNEKKLLSRLNHHHIATLMDAGMSGDSPFLATEWIDGQPIDVFVKQQTLDVDSVLQLFLQVCHAVAHAHNQLIIHRDLKPANILIDVNGQAKLLDFGIAKLIDTEGDGATQTQVFTPDYAAPEQINGEACTTATDVYALGVLLFELFVGSKRFGNTEMSMAERVNEISQPKTVFASQWMAERKMPGASQVKGALDNIINQAMHPEPKRRYSSVHALITDVENYLGHLPVNAMGDGWGYRTQVFIKRNFWPSLMGLLLFVSMTFGMVYSNGQKQRAIEARQAADSEAEKNAQMLGFFQTILKKASPNHGGSTEISVREMFEQSVDEIELDRISDPILRANIAGQIANVYGELAAYDLRIQYDQMASDIYATKLPDYAADFMSRQQGIAYAYRNQSRYQEALVQLSLAHERVKDMSLEPDLLAQIMIDFSELHRGLNQPQQALDYLQLAEQHASAINNAGKMGKIRYYQFIILRYQISADEAENYLNQAMDYFNQAHPGIHPDKVSAKNSLALRYKESGRYHKAVALFENIHVESKQIYGRPNNNQLINHADALYYLGRFDQVIELTQQVLNYIQDDQVAPGMSMMAAKVIQGRAMTELGRYSEAEERLTQAIEFFSQRLSEDHLLMLTLQTYWLDLLLKSNQLNRLDFEVDALVESLQSKQNASDDWKRRMINALTVVGSYHWYQQGFERALSIFSQAQAMHQQLSQQQDWVHWYLSAAVLSLESMHSNNEDSNDLSDSLQQLKLLLPAEHWYHGLFNADLKTW